VQSRISRGRRGANPMGMGGLDKRERGREGTVLVVVIPSCSCGLDRASRGGGRTERGGNGGGRLEF